MAINGNEKNFDILLIFLWCVAGVLFFVSDVNNARADERDILMSFGGRLLFLGQQKDAILDYAEETETVPDGFMIYTSIQRAEGLETPADRGAGVQHADYYLQNYPQSAFQIGLYMVDALKDVFAGKYDENIDKLARWIKKADRPIYLRIGYEFDLPDNHYQPEEYQNAYRHIVDRLRSAGVGRVAYVWHSAAMTEFDGDWHKWYPGDNYVDWFGVSLFNSMQIVTAKKFLDLAKIHSKPLMIAESAPAGLFSARAKQEWFRHYFDFITEADIRIVCYINCHWDQYPMFRSMRWGDSRIQEDAEIKEMWLKKIDEMFE